MVYFIHEFTKLIEARGTKTWKCTKHKNFNLPGAAIFIYWDIPLMTSGIPYITGVLLKNRQKKSTNKYVNRGQQKHKINKCIFLRWNWSQNSKANCSNKCCQANTANFIKRKIFFKNFAKWQRIITFLNYSEIL